MSYIQQLTDYLIPPHSSRIPLSLNNAYVTLAPSLFLLLMASLARTAGTWTFRMGLLPIAVATTLRVYFGYFTDSPYYVGGNHGLGALGVVYVIMLMDLGLQRPGTLKMNELEAPPLSTQPIEPNSTNSSVTLKENGTDHLTSPSSNQHPLLDFVSRGFEFLCSVRGIGWKYGTGTGLHVPLDWRDTSSSKTFILQTLRSCIWHYIVMDLCDTATGLIPDLRTLGSGGKSIFDYGYMISTGIHILTGMFLVSGILFTHELVSILAVLILDHKPSSYPPIMSSSPWNAVSLHDFWSTKWHQVLRHPILVSGGYPLQSILLFLASPFPLKRSTTRIIGDIGLLVGSFTASGLIHHFAMYPIGPGKMPGWPCIGFFMAQSLGMICERIYRAATGRRVGGWIGTMWTWCWIIGGGQICIDSWYRSGFNSGVYVPPSLSPTKLIILPFLRRFIEGI